MKQRFEDLAIDLHSKLHGISVLTAILLNFPFILSPVRVCSEIANWKGGTAGPVSIGPVYID